MTNRRKWELERKRYLKRRERRPEPSVFVPRSLEAPGNVERRMQRDQLDVLQNIEFALVQSYRDSDDVDDEVVEQVLRAAITRSPPADPRAARALSLMDSIRSDVRPDTPEEIWIDGLRVIYTSLRRHSDCQPGETNYLDFVSKYVV